MEEYNERPVYKVYAKANINGQVEKFFSTCFEEPNSEDIYIKAGIGDEFVHVGYYKIFDENGCHNYKIEDGKIVECTDEEKEAEFSEIPVNKTLEERVNELQETIDTMLLHELL